MRKVNARPLRVSLLAVLMLLPAAWNGVRLAQAIRFWKTLAEYKASPGPGYMAVSGGFWLAAGLTLAWGLWLGLSWSWWSSVGAVAGYALWYWFDRLVFQAPHANWPFALALTAASLVIVYLFLFSRRTRRFFQREVHERKPEDQEAA